jgi:hypothetical protein
MPLIRDSNHLTLTSRMMRKNSTNTKKASRTNQTPPVQRSRIRLTEEKAFRLCSARTLDKKSSAKHTTRVEHEDVAFSKKPTNIRNRRLNKTACLVS